MSVSQKCLYALRAVIELARARESGPQKISDVAAAQAIPARFLEVILNELRQGGFVDSRRGKEGGYFLLRDPEKITVGDIIRFVEGPIRPAEPQSPTLAGSLALNEVWIAAEAALTRTYDDMTIAALLRRDRELKGSIPPDFTI